MLVNLSIALAPSFWCSAGSAGTAPETRRLGRGRDRLRPGEWPAGAVDT